MTERNVFDLSSILDSADDVSYHSKKLEKQSKRDALGVRKSANDFRFTVIVILLSIVSYFVGNMIITSFKYPNIRNWFNQASELAEENAKFRGRGKRTYDVLQITNTAHFPAFAQILNFLTFWKDLSKDGAQFLIMSIQYLNYSVKGKEGKLNQLHWNGTKEQTKGDQLWAKPGFLCGTEYITNRDEKEREIFTRWYNTRESNVWYDLFPQTQQGLLSIQMFQDLVDDGVCRNNLSFTILDSLYDGGLCEVAFTHIEGRTGYELFTYMFGSSPVQMKPSCAAQMAEGALNGVAGLGAVGPSLPGFQAAVVANPILTLGVTAAVASGSAYVGSQASKEQCERYQ